MHQRTSSGNSHNSNTKSRFFVIQPPVQGQFINYQEQINENPFKTIAPQPLSRRTSEIHTEEKEVPDTPMTDCKHISMFNEGFSNFSANKNINNRSPMEGKWPSSRYQDDYIELETFGKGHFGKVVRCQNKLDQLEYAIKISQKKIRSK